LKYFNDFKMVITMLTIICLLPNALNALDNINATIYENAQNKNTTGWRVYDDRVSGAVIRNVYDSDRKSRVIEFDGSSTSNGYVLGGYRKNKDSWDNKLQKYITWKMKTSELYAVYISVDTRKGHRYIYYTSESIDKGRNGTYIHHGLGNSTTDGKWHTFNRDLEADLLDFEKDNRIIAVEGILIRGSIRVDDIALMLEPTTVYENAQDKKTTGWRVYDDRVSGAVIRNVYDSDKKSRVIEFDGSGTSNGYVLGGYRKNKDSWDNKLKKYITWKMKTSELYAVYISVETIKGHRYIYYTSESRDKGRKGDYIHHGFGKSTTDGKWHTFNRDLEADLLDFEKDNRIIAVEGILIRGSIRVDDIELKSSNIFVSVSDFGAVGDGVTDDTVALKNAFKSGKHLDMEGKKYLIHVDDKTHIGLVPSHNQIIVGNGAEIIISPNMFKLYSVINLNNLNNVKIFDLTVTGDIEEHENNEGEWGMGFWFVNSKNCELHRVQANKMWGDGYYVAGTTYGGGIFNSSANYNRRNGLSVISSSNFVVSDSNFSFTSTIKYHAPASGIDIEPNPDSKDSIDIKLLNIKTKNNKHSGVLLDPTSLVTSTNKNARYDVYIENGTSINDEGISFRITRFKNDNRDVNGTINVNGFNVISEKTTDIYDWGNLNGSGIILKKSNLKTNGIAQQ